ncbi:hypothetical protein BDZ89DRAFT_1124460, partial [Hymenopellis radicata]
CSLCLPHLSVFVHWPFSYSRKPCQDTDRQHFIIRSVDVVGVAQRCAPLHPRTGSSGAKAEGVNAAPSAGGQHRVVRLFYSHAPAADLRLVPISTTLQPRTGSTGAAI